MSSSLLIQSGKSRYNTPPTESHHTTLHIPCFRNVFLSFCFLPRWAVTLTIIFLSALSRAAFILSSCRFIFLLRAAAVAHQHPEVTLRYMSGPIKHYINMMFNNKTELLTHLFRLQRNETCLFGLQTFFQVTSICQPASLCASDVNNLL